MKFEPPPDSLPEVLVRARSEAIVAGIEPNFVRLGRVKYRAWREWVREEVPNAKKPKKNEFETFYGMVILASREPGVTISETPE